MTKPVQTEGDINSSARRQAWAEANVSEAMQATLKRDADAFLHQSVSSPCLSVIKKAEGGATNEWIKSKVNDIGDRMVDQFTAEAAALVKANPTGSHPLEKTNCADYEKYFARYTKGSELYKAKNRK